jgi:hypothetical protein
VGVQSSALAMGADLLRSKSIGKPRFRFSAAKQVLRIAPVFDGHQALPKRA